jgi:hypothetical protein
MSSVLDQSRDVNGQELHRILSVYPVPGFVKNASSKEIIGDDSLPPHLFADATLRQFPVHTGPATVISSIFFNEKRADIAPGRVANIEQRLARAADYFNVTGYVKRLGKRAQEIGTHDETALPDHVFAIVFEDGDGRKERHYPLRNLQEVKAAAAWFHDNRDHLPFSDRRAVADKILEKAAEFGAGLPEHRNMLEKTAGLGVCAGPEAARLIRTRIYAIGNAHKPSQLQQELEKLAQLCEQEPQAIQNFATLTKLAEVVDQFDREHGVRYDDVLQRPEDVLFAVTAKAAAELDESLVGNVLTGNYYEKAALQRIPLQDLADSLGDDFVSEISAANALLDLDKLARVVPTLPRSDAELFDEVVNASGVMPFAVKSAAVGRSISPQEQMQLANQHTPAAGSLWDNIR